MENHNLEEGDVVLCTVNEIKGATVFVTIHIPESHKETQGSIIFSEIASGRIRNIRDYVVPKKKIVCKVLRLTPTNISLSLRRVSQDEQKQVMEQFKKEKSYRGILKGILKDKSQEAIDKIEKENNIYNFLEQAKKNKETQKKLEKIIGEQNTEKILKILNEQKIKTEIIKKEIHLKSTDSNGVEQIKELLGKVKDSEIRYISAGKYSIKTEAEDKKKAGKKMQDILQDIEKKAKKSKIEFSIKEK